MRRDHTACEDCHQSPRRFRLPRRNQSPVIRFRLAVELRTGLKTATVWGVLPGATDENIAVMAHTDCGLRRIRDDEFTRTLEEETGLIPPFKIGAFLDLDEHATRRSCSSRPLGTLRHARPPLPHSWR